jgi:serine/threonine-protein kinase
MSVGCRVASTRASSSSSARAPPSFHPTGCWPATLALAAAVLPEVRAQWSSAEALQELALGTLFIAGMAVIGATGSHMLWAAGRQVREARRLGSYRLKTRIGGGGHGDVWLARQDPLGRDVALKILKDRGPRGEDVARRFEREARAAATLKHPNTIRIIEFGASDDGVLFIAMELLDGMALDQLVEVAGRLPAARAIHLARQACASLAEAHAAGIVHRDIKPANLFVTRIADDYDFLKLLDFGVARVIDADHGPLTEAGVLFGTPEYMPPEMCSGERADARSDVYSLGAVIYFMLTATPLFPGRRFAETVMSHISREPEKPSVRIGVPLPEALENAVMRCLSKNPDDRFVSVRELDDALAECERAGRWTRDDARAFWVGSKPSLPLRARGIV